MNEEVKIVYKDFAKAVIRNTALLLFGLKSSEKPNLYTKYKSESMSLCERRIHATSLVKK